ncbi:MAG TPA: ATP-binding cassette domain-containing protein [Candidatus Eisenbacteria bacterium]
MSALREETGAAASPSARSVRLEARDLGHRYGRRVGLEPLSFEVAAPGVVAVTGSNGTGKSTLLKIVAGLLRPSRGGTTLTFDGRVVAPARRPGWVGYAGPELAFYSEFGVAENLSFAAAARGLPAAPARVAQSLERVGLGSRAGDPVAALSSGMVQRLRLAFALLHEPMLLLLDEPGSHLDDEGRAVLRSIVVEQGRATLVLIATNDEREWGLAERRIELAGSGLGHTS